MKQKWAESVWCREVTEANLDMEFIYVPEHLKHFQDTQKFFKYGANEAPPGYEKACIYTNVPQKPLQQPKLSHRLLQTYVDTVLMGALVLGGDRYVEETILTTGYWSKSFWQDDRPSPYYVRSPRDIFKNYNGEPHPKTPMRDGKYYRFTYEQCMSDMELAHDGGQQIKLAQTGHESDGADGAQKSGGSGISFLQTQSDRLGGHNQARIICDVMAVCKESNVDTGAKMSDCSNNDYSAMQDNWLTRVQKYVDEKLAQTQKAYFDEGSEVLMGKDMTEKSDIPKFGSPGDGLIGLRQGSSGLLPWPRLCEGALPVWRANADGDAAPCSDQSLNGESYLTQRK